MPQKRKAKKPNRKNPRTKLTSRSGISASIRVISKKKQTVLLKYAGILGRIGKDVNADARGVTVLRAQPTSGGHLLIELSAAPNWEAFAADLCKVVGEIAEVRVDPGRVTLEILYLDPLAEKEEVVAAICAALHNKGAEKM